MVTESLVFLFFLLFHKVFLFFQSASFASVGLFAFSLVFLLFYSGATREGAEGKVTESLLFQ